METIIAAPFSPNQLPHMLHLPVTDKVNPENIRQVQFVSLTQNETAVMAVIAGLAEIPCAHA